MNKQSDKILAEGLIKKGLLTKEVADKCLAAIQPSGESLKNYLVSRKILSEKQILEAVSSSFAGGASGAGAGSDFFSQANIKAATATRTLNRAILFISSLL